MFFLKGLAARLQRSKRAKRSPWFLSSREFERAVKKERHRCDRYQIQFGLISLELYSQGKVQQREMRELAKILRRRLRMTDEFGLMVNHRVGILLPHTGRKGTLLVLDDLCNLAAKKEIYFKSEYMNYPDEMGQDDANTDGTSGEELVGVHGEKYEAPSEVSYENTAAKFDSGRYPWWKRTMDVTGACIGLVVGSPILAAAAVAIKLNSRGPVFFKQKRTGFHGREFSILKLRTMIVNADGLKASLMESNERDGPAFKMAKDPRVTSVGRFLRKVGIDELPQLWNVLIGDMALVGPRPLPCHEDAQCLPWQKRRLETKPGITCSWQIAKSSAVTFSDWMRMDLRYADERSLRTDVVLLAKTVRAVAGGRVEE